MAEVQGFTVKAMVPRDRLGAGDSVRLEGPDSKRGFVWRQEGRAAQHKMQTFHSAKERQWEWGLGHITWTAPGSAAAHRGESFRFLKGIRPRDDQRRGINPGNHSQGGLRLVWHMVR